MKVSTILAALAVAVSADIINNEHLKTEVVVAKDCKRKTIAGDKINVHYRGTLESDGSGMSQRPMIRCSVTWTFYSADDLGASQNIEE